MSWRVEEVPEQPPSNVRCESGSKAYCQIGRQRAPIAFCRGFAGLRRHMSGHSLRRLRQAGSVAERKGHRPWNQTLVIVMAGGFERKRTWPTPGGEGLIHIPLASTL